MILDEARRKAFDRGVEMRPAAGMEIDGMFDQVDVGDIIYEALDESHPASAMPNARTQRPAFEQWEREREDVRASIWEAFDAGVRGKVLRQAPAIVAA